MVSLVRYTINNKEIDLRENSPINLSGGEVANLQKVFFLDKTAQNSSFELEVDGEIFELRKDTENYTLIKKNDQSVFDLNSNLSRGEFPNFSISDLKNLFLYSNQLDSTQVNALISKNKKIVPQNITDEQSNLKALIDQKKILLNEGKTEEQKRDLERLLEIIARLTSLNSEIDYYQNEKKLKEDLTNKLSSKEREKNNISQKISSVSVLTTQSNSLKKQIQDLNLNVGLNNNSLKIEDIKRIRESSLEQSITNIKVSRFDTEIKSLEKPVTFSLSPFIIIIVVEVLIGLLFYLLSFNVTIIYVSLISLLLLIIPPVSFTFINITKKRDNSEDLPIIEKEKVGIVDNSQEDSNILNLSLYNALNSELQKLETLVAQRLEGQNIEALNTTINSLSQEIEKLKNEQKALESKSITSEEYYKKRREVDIMKIEKENLQINFPDLEQSASDLIDLNQKYSKISEDIDSLGDFNSTFPIVVAAQTFAPNVEELLQKESERQIIRIVVS